MFCSKARTKYLVGRTNEWVANPLGLRQTSALQKRLIYLVVQHLFVTWIYCKIGTLVCVPTSCSSL